MHYVKKEQAIYATDKNHTSVNTNKTVSMVLQICYLTKFSEVDFA